MRLFLIDDQVMFRQGLKSLLERSGSFLVSGESKSARQAVERIRDCGTDIIILDAEIRKEDSLPGTVGTLKELFPEISVLVVSRHVDPITVRETLAAGADGFLPKAADSSELFRALRLVEGGGFFVHNDVMGCVMDEFRRSRRKPAPEQTLSERDRRLIEFVSEGMNNKEISKELFVSVSTVKNHLRALFRIFKVSDRTSLVVEAMNRGVLNSLSYRRGLNVS
jgi:two-component system, NarL family, response regulator DegU